MNKQRLLKLIEILRNNTDIDHKLSINQIISLLEQQNIKINNRKTIYDDFKVLADYGYDIEYDNGYYLSEAPFTLSEIKIIIDSLNSLKNLDDVFLNRLNTKLYSFISKYEVTKLKKLEYHNKHKDRKFINRLEDALQAITEKKSLLISRNNKNEELIIPIFLYRQNDYYYLYYHYLNSDKIYHTRFDNIDSMKLSDETDEINISTSQIIGHINESTNAYYSGKSQTIKFKILNDSQYLRTRLSDDFSNIVFSKDGFSIKANVNNVFFSKICAYGLDIKISDKDIADKYKDYLKSIIHNH